MLPNKLGVLGGQVLAVGIVVDSLLSVALDDAKSQTVQALPSDELLAHVLLFRVDPCHGVALVVRFHIGVLLEYNVGAPRLCCGLFHCADPVRVL